ncbi:MAG: ABC transporter ATP-binding protein, partial [Lachnospiraceae bacterium]|nr:ABC transporter ATP-binding protein [Lachnospiraceae bacterium]
MLDTLRKFFDFCNEENKNKLYKAVVLGVLDAIFGAMKIPASFFAIDAVVKKEINTNTFIIVIGFMLLSTVGKMVVNRFSYMLQTEAGYNTCAGKRIEIGEHLRYLPMGY